MSDMGESVATYMRGVLAGTRAVVIYADNGYGRGFMSGFRGAAERVGIATVFRPVATAAEVEAAMRLAAADPEKPAIILGATENDATRAMITLRRLGARPLVLGTSAIASDAFVEYFADQPEYRKDRGYFTDHVYAISPSILDSANAETLGYAERYRLRYGREPRWEAVQGYDATRHAIAAETATQPASVPGLCGNVAPAAFRNLTQWKALSTSQRRDILVTESALGNPRLIGVERVRELSGYNLTIELQRRVVATLMKTLLPLGLMTLIMYASLFFPQAPVKEKVTVAITAALSGAVLLSAINSQLGNVGYVVAVEYVFYAFFSLCLICIVSVLSAERLRLAGRQALSTLAERATRALFLLAVAGMTLAAWLIASGW